IAPPTPADPAPPCAAARPATPDCADLFYQNRSRGPAPTCCARCRQQRRLLRAPPEMLRLLPPRPDTPAPAAWCRVLPACASDRQTARLQPPLAALPAWPAHGR